MRKVGNTVTYIELLKTFYEDFSPIVQQIDSIRNDIHNKDGYRTNNMGGRSSSVYYRFEVDSQFVLFSVRDDETMICLEYRVCIENDDRRSTTTFLDTTKSAQINFGYNNDKKDFVINIDGEFKVLQYPIQEEEYFQRLTQKELQEPELYEYFIDQNKNVECTLISTVQPSSNYDEIYSVLKPKIKKIIDDLNLVIHAYKSTIK